MSDIVERLDMWINQQMGLLAESAYVDPIMMACDAKVEIETLRAENAALVVVALGERPDDAQWDRLPFEVQDHLDPGSKPWMTS